MNRGTKGAADAAAPRLARKRGDKPTIANNVSLARDPRILNWVRARTREGFGTKQLVAASRASEDDWPRPGEQLSDGVLASCRAAIHHLEEQGARWPLKDDGGALRKAKRGPTRTGKRLSELGAKRAAARRAGDPIVLWDTCYDITRLTGLLESLNIEDVDLDEHSLDTVNDLHDDMLFLQDWMDRSIGSVQARLGEHGIRQKIRALRAKTVANGCTPEEEAASQRAADRLEHQLRARLGVAS
jgi:hypothetical protein